MDFTISHFVGVTAPELRALPRTRLKKYGILTISAILATNSSPSDDHHHDDNDAKNDDDGAVSNGVLRDEEWASREVCHVEGVLSIRF